MSSSLPPISSFSSLNTDRKIQILDTLFEPSPELHKLMVPVITHQSFSSYDSLVDAVHGRMQALSAPDSPEDKQVLYGILGSHPRLGEKKSSAAAPAKEHMSDLSRREQANINAGSGAGAAENEGQAERLSALNQEYENTFPGLRFV
jgi:2-oxo-4-hydroxy-4-carboxy--5-ureidoimidazoline (OHCU) decarboxylase